MGLLFVRRFTTEGAHPYDEIEWEERTAKITQGDKVVFEQKGVEFPSSWSQRATNIVASKYFHGSGDKREKSLKDLIGRVLTTIAVEGVNQNYFGVDGGIDEASLHAFSDDLQHILLHQMASFNSPVWFNIGVPDIPQQASACYILGVDDTMESILELAQTEGMIFKRGSGSGVNVSPLRQEGAPLSGGGTASGPLSFMKFWDAGAGVIKSGGITRRAACMRVMNAYHEDIYKFIACKGEEEAKAIALIEAGYDPAIDGEAYGSVFFQNANHSVMIDTLNVNLDTELVRAIAQEAWRSGDPGVMFHDTINKWNTCPNSGKIRATNPCGEYIWLDNTACSLASINLDKFYSPYADGEFDYEGFAHVTRIMITAMDILCGMADYPTEKIKEETLKYRTLGLGYTNLGAMLMKAGVAYDSWEARKWTAILTSMMTAIAYQQSAAIAQFLGPFPEYEKNRSEMQNVISQHYNEAFDQTEWARAAWDAAERLGQANGYRNAQVTVLAPTGTISFMMDCETTGIEPVIALQSYKTLVGGGTMEMIPECAQEAMRKGNVIGESHVLDTALDPDNMISPQGHLDMVAAVQPFLSGGVSKTINLPNSTTVEEIEDIFFSACDKGLKNVTIYRDGSKGSQPINIKKKEEAPKQLGRRKLPDERQSVTHKFSISGHAGYVTVGMYEDGTPGEVFVNMAKEGSTISGLVDSFAKMLSFALQYGISLEFLVRKLKGSAFEPSGHTGNKDIPFAKSVTDYVMRWLENRFLEHPKLPLGEDNISAPTCPNCGILMVTTGNCNACPVCGTSGGCG